MPDSTDALPLPPGVTEGQAIPPEPAAHSEEVFTLEQISKDFVLFTPALLVTHGHCDFDPVQNMSAACPGVYITSIECEKPFFGSLGKTDFKRYVANWDHQLYVTPKDTWLKCRDYINSIALLDRPKRFFARPAWYTIRVLDHPAMTRMAVLPDVPPSVEVTVFAVSSMAGLVCLFAPDPREQLFMPPYPVQRAADPVIVAEGRVFLRSPSPLAVPPI